MLSYGVQEVQEVLGLKKGRAYKVIKDINREMAKKGYLTIAGKVSKKYLFEKFGFNGEDLKREDHVSS